MLTAHPDFPIDPLAGFTDPLTPALREALTGLCAPLDPAAAPHLLGTVLPQFIATGRPLSALAYYVPDCLTHSQIARALQDHPLAHARVVAALERAHALLGVALAKHKGDRRGADSAAVASLRKMVMEDMREIQAHAPKARRVQSPLWTQRLQKASQAG